MRMTESGGSRELGNRFWMEPLRMSGECSRADWTRPQPGASSRILEDHSTDNTREAFAASCRKFPGLTGRIVCVSPYTKLTPTMWWSA
jgi:hypothetical protein